MLKWVRSWMSDQAGRANPGAKEPHAAHPAPPSEVRAAGVEAFSVGQHQSNHDGFPLLNWDAAQQWVESIHDDTEQAAAWALLENAWLAHLQVALGSHYSLRQASDAMLLSSLEPNVAEATLAYLARTLQRVQRVLDGVAQVAGWGKDILIVFDDEETYYRYVSHVYPSAGEFAGSSGMYINAGCGHFVTTKADLRVIEPIIAHEMTHGCLAHLPIPAWLNEGLAVNTEHRISPSGPSLLTPHQMNAKHRAFWGVDEIQQFWSGKSFLRNDDGNMLSYDLARILVEHLSADWPTFRQFVLHASLVDAGAAAAAEHLRIDLGAGVCALLERNPADAWSPNPAAWEEAPEKGAF